MTYRFIFILILIFGDFTAQSPSSKDIRYVESLIDSAYDKTLVVDMKGSSLFAQKALKLSKKINYKKGEAYSNFYLGQGLFELSAYRQALFYLEQAEAVNSKLNDQFLSFEIHRVRSRIFGSMELLKASAREQEKGLTLISGMNRSKNDKEFLRSLAYENLAVTYSKMKDYKHYLFFLSKNQELLEKSDKKLVYPNLISLYAMLGDYYTTNKEYDIAEYYFHKSEDIAKEFDFPFISFTYQRWGVLEYKRKNTQEALEYFKKAIDILNKTNFKSEIPVIYHKMALAYEQLGDKDKADEYNLKSLKLKELIKTEQLKASAQAVEGILSDEKQKITDQHKKERNILLMVIAVTIIFVATAILKYIQNKERKIKKVNSEQLIEKEKENLVLQTKLNLSFEEVVQLAKKNKPEFWARFQEVYPDFRNSILKVNPDLKQTELILCAYVYLGFTAKDIAEYTFKALKTIKNNKYNLRKRLDVPTKDDLTVWIRNHIDS